MQVISWSHSKLVDFERCKQAFKLKHIDRIPEPERPLPPGKTEHANDRGTRVHDECERYVRGETHELTDEAEKHFGPQIDLLRVLYAEGKVSLEGEWGLNEAWESVPWKSAWLRMKLDAMVHWSKCQATVIDYKTGRKFGNEIKHAEQMQIYAIGAFMRYPELEIVEVELWYLDQNEVTRMRFTRAQALRFKPTYHKRGAAITGCTEWKPNPSYVTCQWCQYGPWNGGQCQVGVRPPGKK
jgi:RecB family exonuclease